jgi:hypothetical protein
MPSTSSIDARPFAEGDCRFGPIRAGSAAADPTRPRSAARPRPQVALVQHESAVRIPLRPSTASRQSVRHRQILEICLVALLCLCATFVIRLHQDDSSCSPKLYRDPVTGRVASYGTPHESLKTQARCARLDLSGRNPVPVRVE